MSPIGGAEGGRRDTAARPSISQASVKRTKKTNGKGRCFFRVKINKDGQYTWLYFVFF